MEEETQDQTEEWRRVYQTVVEGREDGARVQKAELEAILQCHFNKNPTAEEVEGLLATKETEAEETITEDEFVELLQVVTCSRFWLVDNHADLLEALSRFDENKDGTISREELRKMLDIEEAALEEEFDNADVNKDGRLNIKELAAFLTAMGQSLPSAGQES